MVKFISIVLLICLCFNFTPTYSNFVINFKYVVGKGEMLVELCKKTLENFGLSFDNVDNSNTLLPDDKPLLEDDKGNLVVGISNREWLSKRINEVYSPLGFNGDNIIGVYDNLYFVKFDKSDLVFHFIRFTYNSGGKIIDLFFFDPDYCNVANYSDLSIFNAYAKTVYCFYYYKTDDFLFIDIDDEFYYINNFNSIVSNSLAPIGEYQDIKSLERINDTFENYRKEIGG